MGKFVFKDATLEVDGVDLSNYVNQVAMDLPDDEVDLSGMGSKMKEYGKGLSDGTITVTFLQDFDTGKVDDTLWPLKVSDTPFTVVVKPTSAPKSATNPEYSMEALLFNYSPVNGSLGEAASTEVNFRNADQAGITRDPS